MNAEDSGRRSSTPRVVRAETVEPSQGERAGVVRRSRGGGVAKGLGPAAGKRQGRKPRIQSHNFPPKTVVTDEEMHVILNVHRDFALLGLYAFLKSALVNFATGEVVTDYATLMGKDDHPRPQKGPKREGLTYEQARRMVRELEGAGLLVRDLTRNAALGELRLYLPKVAQAYEEYERKKTLARRVRPQESAQGPKRRKPAPVLDSKPH